MKTLKEAGVKLGSANSTILGHMLREKNKNRNTLVYFWF